MNIKKKNFIIYSVILFAVACLLSCGIFALADSVKFKLGITLKPSVYFALSLNINGNGEQWIFDNRPTNAHVVEDWVSVKNLTITLDNDLISTASSLELKVYNYNANKFMSFEIYDTAGGVLSINKPSLKNIEYNTSQSLALSNNAIIEGKYTFKVVAEMYDTQISKCNVYVNNIKYDVAYNGVDYVKKIEYFNSSIEQNEEILYAISGVKINGENFAGFSFNQITNEITILGESITGDIEIYLQVKTKYWDGSTATQFSGGDGTENTPFLISNGQELAYFSSVVNSSATKVISAGQEISISVGFEGAYLTLTNDIYLNSGVIRGSDSTYEPVFEYNATQHQWLPIGCGVSSYSNYSYAFKGNFNGLGHLIYNLYINNTSLKWAGLFGASLGDIYNIGMKNGYIKARNIIGGIVGACGGNVYNCFNEVDVVGVINEGEAHTSGVCGYLGYTTNAKMSKCYNTGFVKAGCRHFGGVVGGLGLGDQTQSGWVEYCYNSGAIVNNLFNEYCGGIVGSQACGTVDTSYNFGVVSVAGVVGMSWVDNVYQALPSNCYYLTANSSCAVGYYLGSSVSSANITTGKMETVEEMIISMQAQWDFENVWELLDGNIYPTLRVFNK